MTVVMIRDGGGDGGYDRDGGGYGGGLLLAGIFSHPRRLGRQNKWINLAESPPKWYTMGLSQKHPPELENEPEMSRVCQVTGKRPLSGHRVSHANNKNKRRFLPNLHRRTFFLPGENRRVVLRVSRAGLRLIDKKGLEAVVADLRARGAKI